MSRNIEDLKKELVKEIKTLAADIASSNSYVGLLANEIKFRSLQEKFINLKFLERKHIGLEIFDYNGPIEEDKEAEGTEEKDSLLWDSQSFQDMQIEQEVEQIKAKKTAVESKKENPEKEENNQEDQETLNKIQAADDYAYLVKEEKIYPPIQLDLNDQLAFQHQLFYGDRESMEMVVRTLNAIKNLEDSKKYLSDLQQEMGWQGKEEYVERLEELVMKRFE